MIKKDTERAMTPRELFERDFAVAQKLVDEAFSRASMTQGGEAKVDNHLTVYKNFTFDASHILPKHPGKCSQLHGHTWWLRVGVSGPANADTGFVIDFHLLKNIVTDNLIKEVDHTHLGQGNIFDPTTELTAVATFGPSFYPTSENLILFFRKLLTPLFAAEKIELVYLELKETPTSGCVWRKHGTY